MRRLSCHQSVFDLLGIQPVESARARGMIEECERERGERLPESIRDWYLIHNVVALWAGEADEGHLWYDYSNQDHPAPLQSVLRQFTNSPEEREWGPDRVRVLLENQGVCSWFIQLDGSEDPPVVVDEHYEYRPDHPDESQVLEWVQVAGSFSGFVFNWMADAYSESWTPLSERYLYTGMETPLVSVKPYRNGLWLYAPHAEALASPYLDYLIENFVEGPRHAIAPGVMQYQFRDDHGTLRVTTDDFREEGGASAWWLHADAEEDLFRLARKAWWCANLPTTLRHWTRTSRPVMDRLRQAEEP